MSEDRSNINPTVDVVRVSGEPWKRGCKYAESCKQQIQKTIDAHLSHYDRYCNLKKATVLRLASKYIMPTKRYSSEIADEIAGISEGAERPLEQILMLVAYWEIYYKYSLGSHCTAVAVTGSMTVGGETFVAQNNDDALEPWGESFSRIVHIRPQSGPELITYTYPGFPGQMGLNKKGIALCVNALVTDKQRIGVPFQVIARDVLSQESIGDAVKSIARAERASAGNFLIAEENGEIYDVETTPYNHDIFYSNECMVHTNHFLSTRLAIKKDLLLENSTDTVIRYNRMNRLLHENKKCISLEKLMETFRDHVNYPNSICRHIDQRNRPQNRLKTADCMIYSTTRKTAWIAAGNPCHNQFSMFSL